MNWIFNFPSKLRTRLELALWKIPFLRLGRKLTAIQVVTYGQKMKFKEVDQIARKLWIGRESSYMPTETKKLLFLTKTSELSDGDRDLKLRHLLFRARHILEMAGILVKVCDESEISPYTGWQKDEIEKLIDEAEHPSSNISNPALEKLMNHPQMADFLSNSSHRGRGELVSRALSLLARGR